MAPAELPQTNRRETLSPAWSGQGTWGDDGDQAEPGLGALFPKPRAPSPLSWDGNAESSIRHGGAPLLLEMSSKKP